MRKHAIGLIAALSAGALYAAEPAPPGDALQLTVPAPKDYSDLAAARAEWQVAPSVPAEQPLTWPAFLREVLAANLDYAAARYDIDIASADAAAAKLLPNPTLSLSGDRDLSFHDKYGIGTNGLPALLRQNEPRSIGLSETIELGGKRKWRRLAAEQSLHAAAATLEDFLRNLKLDAAAAYANALSAQEGIERLRKAAGFLTKLTQAQEIRYAAGDIGKPDLTQTRLEEVQFHNDLMKAEADADAARFALSTYLGRNRGQTNFRISGELAPTPHTYDLAGLITDALHQRPDLVALRHTRDAADSGVRLAKATRIPDLDLGVTWTHNTGVALDHPIDPTPRYNELTLSLSVPLPLFDHNQYGVRKAFATADQAQVKLAAAELKAEVEIRTADANYRSAMRRVTEFREDILKSADSLLEARRYSYQRGASTLLELLEAQRSANETRQSYVEALTDAAKALIELERASGVDLGIDFPQPPP